jgi:hypothetical protein
LSTEDEAVKSAKLGSVGACCCSMLQDSVAGVYEGRKERTT